MGRDESVSLGNSCFAAKESKEIEESLLRKEGSSGFFLFVLVHRVGEITACFYAVASDLIECENSRR